MVTLKTRTGNLKSSSVFSTTREKIKWWIQWFQEFYSQERCTYSGIQTFIKPFCNLTDMIFNSNLLVLDFCSVQNLITLQMLLIDYPLINMLTWKTLSIPCIKLTDWCPWYLSRNRSWEASSQTQMSFMRLLWIQSPSRLLLYYPWKVTVILIVQYGSQSANHLPLSLKETSVKYSHTIKWNVECSMLLSFQNDSSL